MIKTFKNYKLFFSSEKITLNDKPKLWGMMGPLPDEVIEYIRKHEKESKKSSGEIYIKSIKGKNNGDYYFFDEVESHWWAAHERFIGKAVILNNSEWNEIFN